MKYFNSNETLEMCDVKVSQDGRIEIARTSKDHRTILGGAVRLPLFFRPIPKANEKNAATGD